MRAPFLVLFVLAAVSGTLLGACDDGPVPGDRDGCGPGFVLDEWIQRCVQDTRRDGGPADARGPDAMDAGLRDGRADVPPVDAGADRPIRDPQDAGVDTPSMPDVPDVPDMPDVPVVIDSGPPPSGCEGHLSGALICDDFESGLDVWDDASGVATFSSGAGFGTQSVRMDASGGTAARFLRWNSPPLRAGQTLYLHALVRLRGVTGGNDAVGIFQVRGSGAGLDKTSILSSETAAGILLQDLNRYESGPRFPEGRWFCLTASVQLRADRTGTVRVAVDGSTVASLTGGLTGDGSRSVALGAVFVNMTARSIVEFDEVAIGTSPLACR